MDTRSNRPAEEGVGLYEGLGCFARVQFHHVQAAAEVAAVVGQLGAAGQQQVFVGVQKARCAGRWAWRTAW
jgi:hypothetical protein